MKQVGVKQKFLLTLLAFCVSAVTPLLIPFSTGEDGNLNSIGYVAGVMFWAGLIVGAAVYILLYRTEKEQIQKTATEDRRPSGLRFFTNPPAKIMDIVLIVGIAGTIYCTVNITVNQMVAAVFLLLMLAGIYAHFLLNGKVYQYIWNYANDKKTSEEKIEGKE